MDFQRIRNLISRSAQLVRVSLLLRFSLLSAAVLMLIAVGLASLLEMQLEQDALTQQADEVAAIVQGVVGPHLGPGDFSGPAAAGSRGRWAAISHNLLLANRHIVRAA